MTKKYVHMISSRNVILDRNGDYVRPGDVIRYTPAPDIRKRHSPHGFTKGRLYMVHSCFEWTRGRNQMNGVQVLRDDNGLLLRDVFYMDFEVVREGEKA
jgi:hypothetical protein